MQCAIHAHFKKRVLGNSLPLFKRIAKNPFTRLPDRASHTKVIDVTREEIQVARQRRGRIRVELGNGWTDASLTAPGHFDGIAVTRYLHFVVDPHRQSGSLSSHA
jgi:hypothetical protein